MTTIYIDSRKRVAGTDADFEFDIGETVHLQGSGRLQDPGRRHFLEHRPRYLFVLAGHGPWHLEQRIAPGWRLHGGEARSMDILELCCRHLCGEHQRDRRGLRRQQAHSERPGAAEPVPGHQRLSAGRFRIQPPEHQPFTGPQLYKRRSADLQLRGHESVQRALPEMLQPGQRCRHGGSFGPRHHRQDYLQPRRRLHHGSLDGRQPPGEHPRAHHPALFTLPAHRRPWQRGEPARHQHQLLCVLGWLSNSSGE